MSNQPKHFFAVENLPADVIRSGTERRSIRLREVRVMFISYDRPTVSPPHDHTWDSIISVHRGEFDVTVGDEHRHLTPGQGTVVPAGVRHTLTTGPGARLIEVWSPMPAGQ